MSYKENLYNSYVTTHVACRKGAMNLKRLKQHAFGFQQHFGKLLPANKNAHIADLGCGSGALVWWLRQSGYSSVKGIDSSPEQVDVAHELNIGGVILGDVFEFLEYEHNFALLFARDLVEHFDKQSAFDFLGKCFASLAPGGRIILQVPNAESPYFGRIRYGDFTHEAAFTSSSIKQLLGAAGFTQIAALPWRPAITGPKSLVRYMAWRALEPLLKLPVLVETGTNPVITMNLIAVAQKPV